MSNSTSESARESNISRREKAARAAEWRIAQDSSSKTSSGTAAASTLASPQHDVQKQGKRKAPANGATNVSAADVGGTNTARNNCVQQVMFSDSEDSDIACIGVTGADAVGLTVMAPKDDRKSNAAEPGARRDSDNDSDDDAAIGGVRKRGRRKEEDGGDAVSEPLLIE